MRPVGLAPALCSSAGLLRAPRDGLARGPPPPSLLLYPRLPPIAAAAAFRALRHPLCPGRGRQVIGNGRRQPLLGFAIVRLFRFIVTRFDIDAALPTHHPRTQGAFPSLG